MNQHVRPEVTATGGTGVGRKPLTIPGRPIAMVVTKFPRFSQTFIVNKFVGLLGRGWNMHIVSPCGDPETPSSLFPELPPPPELARRMHISEDIESELVELDPELIHFEFAELAIGRTYLKKILDCKLVTSFRSPINYSLGLARRRLPASLSTSEKINIDRLWSDADALHLLSDDLWRKARQFGCDPGKIHAIIPPAIDSEFFHPNQRTHSEEVGSSNRPLQILSVGRLHKAKGHEHALEAVRLLQSQGIRCSYRIIGEGGARPVLEAAIRELGLRDVVELLGVRDRSEVKQNMLWADVLLHSALAEPFGNAVLEAQSMSLPVVCTDVEGLPENIADGETGFLVPAESPAALVDKLAQLAGEASLRHSLGVAGRRRIETHFRLEDQITAFEHLYGKVLGRPAESVPGRHAENDVDELTKLRRARREKQWQLLAAHKEIQCQKEQSCQQDRLIAALGGGLAAIRSAVSTALPRRANILVVSRGDEGILNLEGRGAWHFPQMEDGGYLGYHPSDSAAATEHLEELRAKGGQYLLFPSDAFWWLEYYAEFKRHLDSNYKQIWSDDASIIYELGPQQYDWAATGEHQALRSRRKLQQQSGNPRD